MELHQKSDEVFSNLNLGTSKENLTGTLTIGTTRNVADNLLAQYLIDFNDLYPNVKVKILTDSAFNLHEYLEKHKIDILIDYLSCTKYDAKFDMVVIPIGSFNTCFACSKIYYEKIKNDVTKISDLKNLNLVIPGNSRRRQSLDETIQLSNTKLIPIIEVRDSKLVIGFLKRKDFIGYFINAQTKDSDLEILDLEDKLPLSHMD